MQLTLVWTCAETKLWLEFEDTKAEDAIVEEDVELEADAEEDVETDADAEAKADAETDAQTEAMFEDEEDRLDAFEILAWVPDGAWMLENTNAEYEVVGWCWCGALELWLVKAVDDFNGFDFEWWFCGKLLICFLVLESVETLLFCSLSSLQPSSSVSSGSFSSLVLELAQADAVVDPPFEAYFELIFKLVLNRLLVSALGLVSVMSVGLDVVLIA